LVRNGDKLDEQELMEKYKKSIQNWRPFDVRRKMAPHLGKLKPSIGHFYLAQLVKKHKTDVIITTNYDTLIEDSLMDFGIRSNQFVKLVGSSSKIWDWSWINDLSRYTLKIFKICGDLFFGKQFALKSSDANVYISTAVEELQRIIEDPERNMFIILGHGLKEDNIFDLIFKYSNEDTQVVYVNLKPYKPQDNFEKIKGLKEAVENKGIKLEANIIELIDPQFGQFDNFMEKLFERIKNQEEEK
jgi:NAD-dependent SIR2 family protein deacetylase